MDSPSDQDVEAGKPLPGERLTWLSGAWTALFSGIVGLVLILVLILQLRMAMRARRHVEHEKPREG